MLFKSRSRAKRQKRGKEARTYKPTSQRGEHPAKPLAFRLGGHLNHRRPAERNLLLFYLRLQRCRVTLEITHRHMGIEDGVLPDYRHTSRVLRITPMGKYNLTTGTLQFPLVQFIAESNARSYMDVGQPLSHHLQHVFGIGADADLG